LATYQITESRNTSQIVIPAEFDRIEEREFVGASRATGRNASLRCQANPKVNTHAITLMASLKDSGVSVRPGNQKKPTKFRRGSVSGSGYHCPHCIHERLYPVRRMAWYEYLLMLAFLRVWHCPHCFSRFIRGIV
jgi:hypothetical protein